MAASVVRDIMTKNIVMIEGEKTALEAAKIMAENQIRRLVVLSREDKRVVGVISLGDLARNNTTDLSGEVLKKVSEPDGTEPTQSTQAGAK